MGKDDIVALLTQLDGKQITQVNDWVMCSCPLAFHFHESGGDKTLSFGISIHEEDTSIFHCFTCHNKGPVTHLIKLLDKYSPDDYSDMLEDVEATESFGTPARLWDDVKMGRKRKNKLGEPLDIQYLDIYDSAEGQWYLHDREIDDETCKRLQLKFDPEDSQGEPRVLFPIFDPCGNHYGYTGRAIYSDVDPRVRDYHGLKKALVLLGAHLVKNSDKVLLVEGPFDYARGWQFDQPTVASLFSSLTHEQAEILIKLNKPVYGFLDNDKAGREGSRNAAELLMKHVPYLAVAWPTELRWRVGSGVPCIAGDFDQLHEDEVERMISRAVPYRL